MDESYEWDSADASVDVEVLEAMKFDRSNAAFWKGRHDQCTGLQDYQQEGKVHFHVSVRLHVFAELDVLYCMCPSIVSLCCDYGEQTQAFPLHNTFPRPVPLSQSTCFEPAPPVRPVPQ